MDRIEFHALSAIFQPFNGGHKLQSEANKIISISHVKMHCTIIKPWSIVFYRMLRKKRQHQRKETKADNPNSPHEPGPLYDDMEESPGYQELGEVSKPSTYDKLTQWD